MGTPRLTYDNDVAVDTCLRWFEAELNPAFTPSKARLIKHPCVKNEDTLLPSTDWADDICFGDAPFSAQRVALLLRAIVKKPDLVVLDEAFSGMDASVRDKCMLFLTWGETRSYAYTTNPLKPWMRIVVETDRKILSEKVIGGLSKDQALICVSHVKEEVPDVVRNWLSLPEATSGQAARFGRTKEPLEGNDEAWENIWKHS